MHVINTFSHVLRAAAHIGEAVKHIIHLCACFAVLGLPKAITTGNAPAYTSKAFQSLCPIFSISHSTGIPYNPPGQTIVEHSNQIFKTQISKLQQGEFKQSTLHHILNHALCLTISIWISMVRTHSLNIVLILDSPLNLW